MGRTWGPTVPPAAPPGMVEFPAVTGTTPNDGQTIALAGDRARTLTEVQFTPQVGGLIADDTNYRVLTVDVYASDQTLVSTTDIATTKTTASGGTGDWTDAYYTIRVTGLSITIPVGGSAVLSGVGVGTGASFPKTKVGAVVS